jgi:hypothetical protein
MAGVLEASGVTEGDDSITIYRANQALLEGTQQALKYAHELLDGGGQIR